MINYIYRNITDKDFSFINQMFTDVISDTNPHDSSGQVLSMNDFKQRITGLIVESEEYVPIGAAWVQKNTLFSTMFINLLPQYRNKGIGTQLLEKLYILLIENSITEILLSVHNQNAVAIHLYKKQGWIATEKDTEFIQMKLQLKDS